MEGMLVSLTYTMVVISPEALAGYFVTAFFTIINLLITFLIVKLFLFKPAIRFMKKRQEKVAADLADAKGKRKEAEDLLSEGKVRVEKSTHEATSIVEDAKIQAERQSGEILDNARHESIEIISRAHKDVERLKKAAIEEMRDEVADLSLAIAYKVVSQTVDENKQRELVERFIGEEFEGKVAEDA
jgi:F-type H+-transporting ATPase subunit b